MVTAFISHPDCARHEMGAQHPESPARLSAISNQLIASGIDSLLRYYPAPLATQEQLRRVHDKTHIENIFRLAPDNETLVYIDPDTAMNAHSLNAALRAAGGVIKAVDLVMEGEVFNAFCSVRPPGHHAEHKRAMGFCLFNNLAVGVAHALEVWKLERVAIADFDVHHGNGTEDIFKDEPRVLMCSTFQHPFYPYSGADSRSNHIINVPLPAGTTGEKFRQAVRTHWLPALNKFEPQLILISAGFDGHAEDDMANFLLTEQDYAWVTEEIKTIAATHAHQRIVSVLEGGYALSALGRSVAEHIKVLLVP
jgi:acetoin utilization deacetylase AcuC-like enzyme